MHVSFLSIFSISFDITNHNNSNPLLSLLEVCHHCCYWTKIWKRIYWVVTYVYFCSNDSTFMEFKLICYLCKVYSKIYRSEMYIYIYI